MTLDPLNRAQRAVFDSQAAIILHEVQPIAGGEFTSPPLRLDDFALT